MTNDTEATPCVVVPETEDITARAGTEHGRAVLTEVLPQTTAPPRQEPRSSPSNGIAGTCGSLSP